MIFFIFTVTEGFGSSSVIVLFFLMVLISCNTEFWFVVIDFVVRRHVWWKNFWFSIYSPFLTIRRISKKPVVSRYTMTRLNTRATENNLSMFPSGVGSGSFTNVVWFFQRCAFTFFVLISHFGTKKCRNQIKEVSPDVHLTRTPRIGSV